MRKFASLVAAVALTFGLSGCSERGSEQYKAWEASGIPALNRCVAADRAIAKGKVIEAADVFEMPVSAVNIPIDAIMCKDFAIGQTATDEIGQGSFVTGRVISEGQKKVEEQKSKFAAGGNQLTALCAHKYGGFYEADAKDSVYWKCSNESGIPEGQKIDLTDFEQLKGEVPEHALQNCWMLAGRVSKFGMFDGKTVSYNDIDYSDSTKVSTYAASKDIPAGKPIIFKDLKAIVMTSDKAPVSAVCDAGLLGDSVAHVKIPAGTMIRAWDLDDEGSKPVESKEADGTKADDGSTEKEEKSSKRRGKGKKHR